jgi:hypothetical protein
MSILPNPFKMLDLELEKRMKATGDKCNKCDDKKEGFNNLKKDKPVIEGFTTTPTNLLFVGTLLVGSIICFIAIGFWFPIESIKDISIKNTRNNLYMLFLFILFPFISVILHTEDDNHQELKIFTKYWFHIPLFGCLMFGLRFIPGLIGYFENTVGHLIFLISTLEDGGLNEWLRSDNFEALTTHNAEITTNFNPLMSLFNLENYDHIIDKMRIGIVDKNKDNTSDFYVSLVRKDGIKTSKDFEDYINNKVITKRVSGEVTLLVITTLLSAGIIKSFNS